MYYVVFVISVFILFWFGKRNIKNDWVCRFFIIIIFALGAFRDTCIGTDIMLYGGGDYYSLWKNPFHDFESDRLEYGFIILTYILKKIYNSYYFYYGSLFIINFFLYYKVAKKINVNPAVFFAILFVTCDITYSFNILRQMLGFSLGMFVFVCFQDKFVLNRASKRIINVLWYELFIFLISVGFHYSIFVLALLPLFIIPIIQKLLNKDVLLWGLLVSVVYIMAMYQDWIQLALLGLQRILKFGDRADFWMTQIEISDIEASHGIGTTIIMGSLAILISKGRRDVYFYIGFVGFLLSNLASVNLGIMGRVFLNYSLFLELYYSKIWFCIPNRKSEKIIFYSFKILLILFWARAFYYGFIMVEDLSPYKSYLL